jgi:phospholipase/carboxylesterase
MGTMKRAKIAGLDVVLTGGIDREGGGTGPLVVLMHGFGAPGDDLVGLHRVMRVPRTTRFAFPAAPHETHMMPGADSRAWWMIDMAEMQNAIASGDLHAMTERDPDGLDDARARIDALLTEIRATLSPSALVLGGFSQGSMLALDVALRTSQKIDALAILSGTLLARDIWIPKFKTLEGKRVFQSHGRQDPILPFAIAEELSQELGKAGALTSFTPFRGGHEIPSQVLDALCKHLEPVLSGPQ